jgi:bacteriocin biosynthesis cyclodehydratase domain-containing protein
MKTLNKISARDMGMAVSYDPQFRMPLQPKISEHIRMIPFGSDGFIFDGVQEKQWIRGNAARRFLPELIPLLDGTRTVDEIVQSLPHFPGRFIYDALALLYSRGLIFEGSTETDKDNKPHYKFFERHLDMTRANWNPRQAVDRLRQHSIWIAGFPEDVRFLTHELKKYDVSILENYDAFMENRGKRLAVIICDDKRDIEEFREMAKTFYEQKIPWVLVTFRNNQLYLGPYFETGETPCLECLLSQRKILFEPSALSENTNTMLKKAGLAYSGVEIIHLLARLSSSLLLQGMKQVDLECFQYKSISLSKVPNCPVCDLNGDGEPIINLVTQYESYVEFPSHRFINPKDHQNHYKPSNLDLAKSSLVYPGNRQIPLPPDDCLPNLDFGPGQHSPLHLLAKLMLYTTGFKKMISRQTERVYRWAPTGGNLGSVGFYFLNIGLNEINHGLYFYQPSTHSLAMISRCDKQCILRSAAADATVNHDRILGYVIFTGSYDRVSKKYKEFAYKIIHLDAGVAFAQLQIAAEALNLGVRLCQSWQQDDLEALLKIDWSKQPVTLAATLYKLGENHESSL